MIKGESKKGGWLQHSTMSILMNSVTFIIFYGDLLYKSPVFKVFKNRRLTLNVIKVTEIIRIDIVECLF